jgi:uncharacterized phage protein (TIGR01671 family)
MREFKFRAWDVINKKMYPVAYPTWNGATEGKIDFVNHTVETIDEDGDDKPEVMQFTGLIDQSGKEVYEGDILNIWYSDIGRVKTEQVVYRNDSACFDTPDVEDWNRAMFDVIGNIYENPELHPLLSNLNWVEPKMLHSF